MHAHVRLHQQSTRAHRYSLLVLSRHTNPVPGVCVAGKGVGGALCGEGLVVASLSVCAMWKLVLF